MALNKTISAVCALDGYLFCRMPEDTLEVEVKIKTKWGIHNVPGHITWREKYHSWDRADRRSNMCTKRRKRTPRREVSSHNNFRDQCSSGTRFRLLTQVFTDTEFAVNVPHMEEEEVNNDTFIGNYCETCVKCGETQCWCSSSNWGEELIDVENPNTNPTLENKMPSPETFRKTPAGRAEYRRRTVKATQENNRNILIENSKSISQEEFNNNNSM